MPKIAALLAIPVLAAGSLSLSAPAQAADTQKICESKYSSANFRTDKNVYWSPGECKTITKGTRIVIDERAYKVGYDYGDYSGCRPGDTSFVPYQKPQVIYFREYTYEDCTN